MNTAQNIDKYLSGETLIGDSFSEEEIRDWFRDEEEAYANLGAQDRKKYRYVYHELNRVHGYSNLPAGRFRKVLGVGSAYGEEFHPFLDRIDELVILDPSDKMSTTSVGTVPVNYKKPNPLGQIELPDNMFDLITCFGVLHHVPNVSFVVKEMGRVLKAGGYALIREPVVNMGDWRQPRRGLTSRERGIPETIMLNALDEARIQVVSKTYCDFAPVANSQNCLPSVESTTPRALRGSTPRSAACSREMSGTIVPGQYTRSLRPRSSGWAGRSTEYRVQRESLR